MAGQERLICAAGDLAEKGAAVRFAVGEGDDMRPAFVLRHGGQVRAYLNRCAHRPMEMDWQPGQFLDITGLYLVCATHGALYRPDTGACVAGPCNGQGLVPLPVLERDGAVYLLNIDGPNPP